MLRKQRWKWCSGFRIKQGRCWRKAATRTREHVAGIASEMDTSLGSAYSIGGDQQLTYREVGASSVPKNFTHDHTTHRMGLMHVTRYVRKVRQFPQFLVTRAETSLMRHLKLKKYKHPLPGDTHFLLRQVTPSVRKKTEAVFRGHNGVLLVEFTDRRTQWLLYIIVE
jgi:hypothetical protein